jgi:GR25 family glycosyltransferase involved in LPS biosynthesis
VKKNSVIVFFLCLLSLICSEASVWACLYKQETPVVNFLKPADGKKIKSGIKRVDCIYVINLDKRPEKWLRMKRILKKQGLAANRFSAVNGWEIDLKGQEELAGNYPLRMMPGEIGCLLSHVSVIKDALDRGYKAVWILEDDIEFIEDPHQISGFIAQLNKKDPNWDILYTDIDSINHLGVTVPALDADFRPDLHLNYTLEHYLKRIPISYDLMRLGQRYGMYSLLISRKGMKKVYQFFSHVYLWSAIDIDIHYIPTIREYSTRRDIVSIWWRSTVSDTKNQE